MKKIKLLLVMFVVTIILATLSGCNHTHDHDWVAYNFEWVNGDDYQEGYMRCKECLMRFDPNKLYEESLELNSYIGVDMAYGSKVDYVLNLEKGRYDYNEEFDISLKIVLQKGRVEQGYFYIRLSESPYYEIIGEKEQSVWFSGEEYQETYTIKFRVKAIEKTNFPQRFDFKMKFNANKHFDQEAQEDYLGDLWYYNPSDEYFYGTKQLAFINDELGMYLEDAQRCSYLFQNSINREYLAGKLDKDAYCKRMREYNYSNGVYTSVMYENSGEYEGMVKCLYGSPNILAKFHLLKNAEYYHQIKDWLDNYEDGYEKMAKLLVGILYKDGYISLDDYMRELEYISEMEANGDLEGEYSTLIPIEKYYKDHYYDYDYVENSDVINYESSGESNENLAVVLLSSDRIDVSAGFDLYVHTKLSDSIESIDIEKEDGLTVCSDIEINDNVITLSLVHNDEFLTPKFGMKINIFGTETDSIDINVYGYANGEYLYLSQWSENEAYNVFMDYANATVEQEITIEDIWEELNEKNDDVSTETRCYNNTDTEIRGTFYWEEYRYEGEMVEAKTFPLQSCIVSFFDREAIGESYIGSCLTNDKGEYSFKFLNDTSLLEGGMDVIIRVWAAGEDVVVTHGPQWLEILYVYYDDVELDSICNNISSGVHEVDQITFKMNDCEENTALFGQALQLSQAAIFASNYYKQMKGTEILPISIVYPHNKNNTNCFYEKDDYPYGRIHIVGDTRSSKDGGLRSFESWDAIMHEYGHFVADKEGIEDTPGGWHGSGNTSMAEHYATHFSGGTQSLCSNSNCAFNDKDVFNINYKFNEDDCKEQGIKIAWSEGFATYFAMASQEYYSDYLAGVQTVADGRYTSYNGALSSIRKGMGTTDDTESTVYSILYDIYDSPSEDPYLFDDYYGKNFLSLGHEQLWKLIMNSKAKTFDTFDNYCKNYFYAQGDLISYSGLLAYHNLAPGDWYDDESETLVSGITVSGILTAYCPTFSWTMSNNAVYFTNNSFKLNFYNSSYELIGSTSEYTNVTSITVDETLWHNVLNSGDRFYVSVTIIENHEPKTDYEGQWYEFNVPVQTATIDTDYVKTLGSGDCHWYKFTVPATADYIFETSGNVDTVGDISNVLVVGRSINGLTYIYGSGGELENFRFTEYLTEGETVYIRIRGANWTSTGSYVFNIEQVEHTHDYTDHYLKISAKLHRSYCICGAYTNESHHWGISANQYICHYCGYFTKDFPSITPGIMSFDNEAALYYYGQDEEEEIIR